MNYTFNQLRVFLKVVELSSITKASEELFLTQPAVSIQLKKLQDQFAVPLTEIVGRQLFVTDFGEEIANITRRILEEVEQINIHTDLYKNRLAGRLKISVASTGKYVMPYYLSGFLQENPAVELVMDVTNKTRVVKSMDKNEVDFALVSVLPNDMKIESINLLTNSLYLVASPKLKINKEKVNKKVFEQHPLIYRESGSATRAAMEQIITGQNLASRQRIELTSNEAVKQAILAGLGISIMPIIGIKSELANNSIEIIPLAKLPIQTAWSLVWMEQKNLSPVATAFLEYIRENKKKIRNTHFDWVNK